jgi:plasmid stabilization system protein ParE
MDQRTVIWTARARKQLAGILIPISRDSQRNAHKLELEIFSLSKGLSYAAQAYPKDYQYIGKEEVRKFTHKNIRVSFIIEGDEVVITKVSHAKRKPRYWLR